MQKSGARVVYGERIGQGRERVKEYLKGNPEMMAEIERRVLAHHGVIRSDSAPTSASEG